MRLLFNNANHLSVGVSIDDVLLNSDHISGSDVTILVDISACIVLACKDQLLDSIHVADVEDLVAQEHVALSILNNVHVAKLLNADLVSVNHNVVEVVAEYDLGSGGVATDGDALKDNALDGDLGEVTEIEGIVGHSVSIDVEVQGYELLLLVHGDVTDGAVSVGGSGSQNANHAGLSAANPSVASTGLVKSTEDVLAVLTKVEAGEGQSVCIVNNVEVQAVKVEEA